jgi:ribosomal-protein-alanine N-acetyltransferase
MTVEIETVGIEAAAMLAALHRLCLEPGGERSWSTEEFADLLRLPTTWTAIAIDHAGDDRIPAGFILCTFTSEEGEVLFVGVDPNHRRCGVGQSLLSEALETARMRGLHRVMLEVAADNFAASRLYGRASFSPVGRRAGYYHRQDGASVDAIVMRAVP